MESDLKLALDRVAQQEEEMAELSDSAHTSIKRTLVHKNRTAYLERQLDKVARRCERLQGELDGAVRDRRQAQSKLMTTTALGRTTSTSSGGAGGPAAASRAADAAVMAAIKVRPLCRIRTTGVEFHRQRRTNLNISTCTGARVRRQRRGCDCRAATQAAPGLPRH